MNIEHMCICFTFVHVCLTGYAEEESIEVKEDTNESKHVEIIDMTKISPDDEEMKEIQEDTIEEVLVEKESMELRSSPVFEVPVQVESKSLEEEIKEDMDKSCIKSNLEEAEKGEDDIKSNLEEVEDEGNSIDKPSTL